MFKGKNKKTVIIVVVLIIATIFSVFAITDFIQSNKAASSSISPYKYQMVVAYFGYWLNDDGYYYADIPDKNGNARRTNIGTDPIQYTEWDYWFPVATLPGNYEIKRTMNFNEYKGEWKDLNYSGEEEDIVRKYYMNTARIENEPAVVGAINTTVHMQASFTPLPPNKAYEVRKDVYKCYIAIVIEYKDLDYVEPPVDPDPDPNPGTGNLMVYVNFKEKGTEKTLADMQKVRTSMGSNLVVGGISIDGYLCVGSQIKGKTTKTYESSYINEVVGRYDYTTPPDGYLLQVTFWYEKAPKPPDYRCEPDFDADAEGARVTMKRSDFDKAEEIYFKKIHAEINETRFGYNDGMKMPGTHGFESMDVYFRYGESGYDFQRTGIFNKKTDISLNVPQNKFIPTNPEKTEYIMPIEVHVGVWCSCGGFSVDKTGTYLYVDIVENQPPEAIYKYSTIKTLPSGHKSKVYNKAYIGQDVVIDNYCSDPNGTKDIDNVVYTFINSSGEQKKIKFKMQPWLEYEQVSADDFSNTSIIYNGADDDGNLDIIFTTDEEWRITIYVQDKDGLADVYGDVIKPEVLSLKPTAVIKDIRNYRYPDAENEFNGKQNRVIKLNSNSSYVAEWLSDMNVSIDHSKDMWQIEPFDGQNINSIKFEKDINKNSSGNILNVRYEPLNTKMMFKEPGRYKVKLQVTDTDGNISNWSEQMIIIHPDLAPIVTADISPKYYRNSQGIASINLKSNSISPDFDIAKVTSIKYKYDSNNDGSFDDEVLTNIPYNNQSIVTLNKLGKYKFIINSKEEFGQETISKYITDSDFKTSSIVLYTEVDNIAPDVTKFKIMTRGD